MEAAADIIIHVALVATFIIIFFFTYASMVEKKIISNETREIVQVFASKASSLLSDEQNEYVRSLLKKIEPPDMSSPDADVKQSNSNLMRKTFWCLAIVLAASAVVVSVLHRAGSFSIGKLFWSNILALVVIAVVYFCFLTLFAKNYKPSDYSLVENSFFKTLDDWASS